MQAKIRVRVGEIEVDYEGEAEFLQKGLIGLLTEVADLFKGHIEPQRKPTGGAATQFSQLIDKFTSSIATKLGAKSGADLAIAAAAHLALAKGMKKFTRKELLAEMQGATTFYKKTYNNNLTKILNGLVRKDRLNEVGKDTYALSDKEYRALREKLA